jgi:hypothetical protein
MSAREDPHPQLPTTIPNSKQRYFTMNIVNGTFEHTKTVTLNNHVVEDITSSPSPAIRRAVDDLMLLVKANRIDICKTQLVTATFSALCWLQANHVDDPHLHNDEYLWALRPYAPVSDATAARASQITENGWHYLSAMEVDHVLEMRKLSGNQWAALMDVVHLIEAGLLDRDDPNFVEDILQSLSWLHCIRTQIRAGQTTK